MLTIPAAHADIPGMLNYQGRITVSNTNFNGTGQFKFALVNSGATQTYWSNGVNAVSLTVTKGLYSVLLGDTTLANMATAIQPTVFTNSDVRLRVWFNDGVNGLQQLTPDQRLAASGYALMASNADQLEGQHGSFYQNATNLNAGTLPDARLSTNIALRNTANTFATTNLFNGPIGIGTTAPNRPLTIGGTGASSEWISLQDTNDVTRWHLNGTQGGLNVSQTLIRDGVLFLSTNGYVGIGKQNPSTALDVTGTVTATAFSGNGAALTNVVPADGSVTAAKIAMGAVGSTQLAANLTISGTLTAQAFSGDGSGVTNVNLLTVNSMDSIEWTNKAMGKFTLASTPYVGPGPYAVAAADVNSDGKQDLISATYYSSTLLVITNDGRGNFDFSTQHAISTNASSVTTADVNGDGKIDLISANLQNNTVSVLTNKGNGTFATAATLAVGGDPRQVIAADLNNDSWLDLVTANQSGNSLSVLTNRGNGVFAAAFGLGVGVTLKMPTGVAAADVNGDGWLDLISANSYDQSYEFTLTVLTNNRAGGFTKASSPSVGAAPCGVAAADINRDGKVDLISANYLHNNLTLLLNAGSGNFTYLASPSVGVGPLMVTATDLTGDGAPDLVSANESDNSLTVLHNDGRGNFYYSETIPVGPLPRWVMAADFNNDSKPDLASANYSGNTASVLTNSVWSQARFIGSGEALSGVNATQLGSRDSSYYLNAGNLSAGTLPDARLSWNIPRLDAEQEFTSANTFSGTVMLTNPSNTVQGAFTGNGTGLTNVNAALLGNQTGSYYQNAGNLNVGTLLDARLSANIPLLNAPQVFSASNRFSGVMISTNAATKLGGTFTGTASGTLSGTFSGTGSGTFSGDGSGLTNLTSSGDYVYAYSTNTLNVAVVDAFQDIPCNVNGPIDGWTHTAGTATFTCNQTGLYWIQFDAEALTDTTASSAISLRAVLGGVEIAGSQAAFSAGILNLSVPLSKGFLAAISNGNVLKFQFAGSHANNSLVANTGTGTTRPSFSCTIIRLK
jgi:hypothetical protein